jgi:hypothetical protein
VRNPTTVDSVTTISVETPNSVEMAHSADVARFPGVLGTFMGRDALSLAVRYLGLNTSDTVLLPVYTCQEVLAQFVKNTNVLFYDVQPDLTIDPDEVRAKLKGNRVSMMMITNYFGFLQPFRNEIKEICTDRGISLIEDCAHSLLTLGSGETGDLSIYSFRKILPTPDGGGLRVNRKGERPVPRFYPRAYSNAISAFIMAKSLLNIRTSMLSRARITSHTAKVLPRVTLPENDNRILPLSYFAQRRMANVSFPEIVERRRSDFQFWQDMSRKSDSFVPVFEDLPSEVCPLGFPVRIEDRGSIELRARSAGIKLSVHWRLDVALGPECVNSHKLSRQMLTLPVYPELDQKAREVLSGILLHQ